MHYLYNIGLSVLYYNLITIIIALNYHRRIYKNNYSYADVCTTASDILATSAFSLSFKIVTILENKQRSEAVIDLL